MARRPLVPPELMKGAFTLEQARAFGVSRMQLQGVSWRNLGKGVYVWAGIPDSPTVRLAAVRLRLPREAAFSGRTAAWLHGLDLPLSFDPIEVTEPDASGLSVRVGLMVRRVDLGEGDVVVRLGFRTTSITRTLADLARTLSKVEAVVAIDTALHGRLVDLNHLDAWVRARRGKKGVAALRRFIALAEPASESPMETRLRILLLEAGLPRPESQVNLFDAAGRFLARVDLYYPDARLAIEFDGGHHRDTLVADNRRQNDLLGAGYDLLRFTSPDITNARELVVARVRAARSKGLHDGIRGRMHLCASR